MPAPARRHSLSESARLEFVNGLLRSWGLELKEKVGFKRAAVAVARKLAVIMHAMLKTGATFDPAPKTTA